jgi:hypothetical protein
MNTRQRAILVAAIALVAILLLFPPWYATGGKDRDHRFYRGYHFINDAPGGASRIDYARSIAAIAFVCFVAALAYFEVQDRRPRGGGGESSSP